MSLYLALVQLNLTSRSKARADDPGHVIEWFRPGHDDDPATRGPDSDEALLVGRMRVVVKHNVIFRRLEQRFRLSETYPVLDEVRRVLGRVPIEEHSTQCKPMAERVNERTSVPYFTRVGCPLKYSPMIRCSSSLKFRNLSP